MSQTLPASGLLTSWKEIAGFLGKGVRTVQRWEATLGLPVIRPADRRSGIVMARPAELEAWILKGRHRRAADTDDWHQKNEDAWTAYGQCMREFRSCQAEVKALQGEVEAARALLRQEVEKLKSLYQDCDAIRARSIGEGSPREPATKSDGTNGTSVAAPLLRN